MKCKDCIYLTGCLYFYHSDYSVKNTIEESAREYGEKEVCELFKDKSLFIELPCKVNDTVYAVSHGKVHKTSVYSLSVETENGHYCYYIKCSIFCGFSMFIKRRLGEGVYLTREEAERALKGAKE